MSEGSPSDPTLHTAAQQRRHWAILGALTLTLAVLPLLAVRCSYRGSPDLHAAMELLGAASGLFSGLALVIHFYTLGNRLYLFIGLGFLASGAADVMHGLLSFRNPLALSDEMLARAIPGTYVTGRLMLGLLMCVAARAAPEPTLTGCVKRDTVVVSLVVLIATMLLTTGLFLAPVPALVFPDAPIPRPVDFLSALVFTLALGLFLRRYRREHAMLLWWSAATLVTCAVGQFAMAFARRFYDPLFDLGHVYKALGYLVPLLGLGLYQIAVIRRRQQAEAELRASEARLRQIIDMVPHFIFAKDEEGRFFLANRAMAAAYGTTVDKVLGATDADFCPTTEEVLHFRENDLAVIRSGQPKFIPEETLIDAAGNLRVLQTIKIPFTVAGTARPAVLGVATDITHLKRAEEALREAQQELNVDVRARTSELARAVEQLQQERSLLHALMDHLPHNIYFKDRASRFLRINRAMANYFKLADPAEAVGKSDLDFFTTEHAMQALDDEQRILQTGEPVIDFEEKETWGDGHTTWVSTTKMPLRDEQGRIVGTFGISRDITERKLAAEALHQAKEAAETANRAKSVFLANMSHEIRTPMNAILGMTELVLDTSLSSQQREFLLTVQDSAESLLSVINDILDFSKIEAGKFTLDCREFDLREMLGDTLKSLAVRAHSKHLELAYRVQPDVPELVCGDPHRLRQVLVNLVGNAVKFTDHGEVVLEVAGAPPEGVEATSDIFLQFSVRDTGLGIPADKLSLVFHAFEQADSSSTRRHGGTGLGLAISARLTELMGGRIWVESQVGHGSTFHFTARFGRVDTPVAPAAEPIPLAGMRVLVVDDNATNRRILLEVLRNWRMEPVAVASAAEALAALKEAQSSPAPFRLVLTDAAMPETDGFALARQIREDLHLEGTLIMMLSSADAPGEPSECARQGIVCHLLKPIRQSELLEAIQMALGAPELIECEVQTVAAPPVRSLRILVAEDSLVNQKLAINLLQRHGHEVIIAGDGREALAKWEQQPFDMILMDVQMPEMDGLEATARIRAKENRLGRHIPIIAMTAHALAGDRQRCLEAGMDDYVAKPIRAGELFAKINEVARTLPPAEARPAVGRPGSVIRWDDVLPVVNGDRDLLKIVAGAAREEIPKLLEAMRVALQAGDAQALRRAAHTFKGSVRYFGVEPVFDLGCRIEQWARQEQLDPAAEGLQDLEKRIPPLLADLENVPSE